MPRPLIDQAPGNDVTSLTTYTTHTHVSDTNIYIYIIYSSNPWESNHLVQSATVHISFPIIQKATHYSNSGSPSTIDLVFIPTCFQPCPYSILPPVSSDHNNILFSLSLKSISLHSPTLFLIVCGCMTKLIIS